MSDPPRSGSAPKVLVVESDPDYRAVIVECVERAGCRPEAVASLEAAQGRLQKGLYDLIVWGIQPAEPDRSGGVARLRQAAEDHLIMIDESFEEAKAVFEAGADQVLPKPFVPGALVGAIRAGLRAAPALPPGSPPSRPRSSAVGAEPAPGLEGLTLDPGRRGLECGGRTASLTRREWELLDFLVRNPSRYLTARALIRQAWDSNRVAPEQLRSYIGRVRRKLAEVEAPVQILSQQGRGYCLAVGTATPAAIPTPAAGAGRKAGGRPVIKTPPRG